MIDFAKINKETKEYKEKYSKELKEIRQRTGICMYECIKAFKKSDHNIDEAVYIIKSLGPRRKY